MTESPQPKLGDLTAWEPAAVDAWLIRFLRGVDDSVAVHPAAHEDPSTHLVAAALATHKPEVVLAIGDAAARCLAKIVPDGTRDTPTPRGVLLDDILYLLERLPASKADLVIKVLNNLRSLGCEVPATPELVDTHRNVLLALARQMRPNPSRFGAISLSLQEELQDHRYAVAAFSLLMAVSATDSLTQLPKTLKVIAAHRPVSNFLYSIASRLSDDPKLAATAATVLARHLSPAYRAELITNYKALVKDPAAAKAFAEIMQRAAVTPPREAEIHQQVHTNAAFNRWFKSGEPMLPGELHELLLTIQMHPQVVYAEPLAREISRGLANHPDHPSIIPAAQLSHAITVLELIIQAHGAQLAQSNTDYAREVRRVITECALAMLQRPEIASDGLVLMCRLGEETSIPAAKALASGSITMERLRNTLETILELPALRVIDALIEAAKIATTQIGNSEGPGPSSQTSERADNILDSVTHVIEPLLQELNPDDAYLFRQSVATVKYRLQDLTQPLLEPLARYMGHTRMLGAAVGGGD